jgi:ribosomal protein S18 acetylase RimI-like enzyme
MAPPPYAVRRFEIEEAALLRQIRLLALKDTPEAFGTGYAQDAARSIESWQQWLITHPSFGAFVGGDPRGMVSFSRQTAANLVHRGSLVAMYVTPDLRGTGAAAAIVEALLAHAGTLVDQVHLSVNADNLRAVRFYRRMGFVEYGREPAGLRHAGIDHDVLLMMCVALPKSG